MKHRRIFVVVLVLISISVMVFLSYRNKFSDSDKRGTLSPTEAAERLRLHPLASPEKITEAEQQHVSTWEEWIDAHAEIVVAQIVLEWDELPTTVEQLREMNRYANREIAENFQAVQMPPPKTAGGPSSEEYAEKSVREKARELAEQYYQGPQTPEALMAEFGEKYLERYPESSEWDTQYPVKDWLQKLINKDVEFKEFKDYSYFLRLRRNLIRLKDDPDQWQSGNWGIPITNNFEIYEENYIDRKIWEDSMVKQVRVEYPNEPMVSVFFPSHYPDKYLPTIGKTTFVRRKGDAMSTWGTMLTEKQRDDLFRKGIEPEDIEIVYIDDEYNILSEKPKPYNREEWLKENSFISEIDGIPLTPENYEKVVGEPTPDSWKEWYEKKQTEEIQSPVKPSPIDPNAARREAARAAAEAAQAAAKAEYEKFENRMRQIEEFSTMSDAEIEKSLERQFRKQFLPEHPVEQLELITPERLERALGTLFQHGFEKGIQRIRKDNKVLADMLENYFGAGHRPPPEMPKRPERPTPPKPPEAP